MKKRWYDLSPDVCITISRIEMADDEDRTRYAKIVLKELQLCGYKPNNEIYMKRVSSYEMKRWYDNNRTLFVAFEYLKDSDNDIQKKVAKNVLKFIELDNAA